MRDNATARFDGPWPTHRNTHASRRTHPPLSPGAKPACPFGGARQSPRASGIPIPVPTTRAPASRSRYFTEAYRPAGLNMPPLPTRAHAAGQAPPHSTPTTWHATPRHTAVLKLARSAPGSCSRLGSVPIRSARPGPVWVRTATPLPACWVPCQPASPLTITTFANPASPGLPPSPSTHHCLLLLPLHPNAEPRKDGRAGRTPSRVRQTHPRTRACMPCC